MFEIKNLSPNALTLSDGTMLARFVSTDVQSLGESEKKYQSRGWLQVTEKVEKPQPVVEEKTEKGEKKK